MSTLDIGIDLGTCTIIAGTEARGIAVREPAVVAVNAKTGTVIDIGENVYRMIGRTPDNIRIVRPVEGGVVSHFGMTEILLRHLIEKVGRNRLLKPRVIVCVPSVITGVESQSVIDAAVSAGARQVFLLEEPVAAAIGAGLDITKPHGNMIVDIGGGTSDFAVLSLSGVVQKYSLRTAGKAFDEAIIRHMRTAHALLIGERTAEDIKIKICNVFPNYENLDMEVKGRGLVTGLPAKTVVNTAEFFNDLHEVALEIVAGTQNVLERTPPELVGDIKQGGIVMTGGGSQIQGLDSLISDRIGVRAVVARGAVDCVVLGTIRSFKYIGTQFDGFVRVSAHNH